MVFAAVPCGGGKKKITAEPMQTSAVKIEERRGKICLQAGRLRYTRISS